MLMFMVLVAVGIATTCSLLKQQPQDAGSAIALFFAFLILPLALLAIFIQLMGWGGDKYDPD